MNGTVIEKFLAFLESSQLPANNYLLLRTGISQKAIIACHIPHNALCLRVARKQCFQHLLGLTIVLGQGVQLRVGGQATRKQSALWGE